MTSEFKSFLTMETMLGRASCRVLVRVVQLSQNTFHTPAAPVLSGPRSRCRDLEPKATPSCRCWRIICAGTMLQIAAVYVVPFAPPTSPASNGLATQELDSALCSGSCNPRPSFSCPGSRHYLILRVLRRRHGNSIICRHCPEKLSCREAARAVRTGAHSKGGNAAGATAQTTRVPRPALTCRLSGHVMKNYSSLHCHAEAGRCLREQNCNMVRSASVFRFLNSSFRLVPTACSLASSAREDTLHTEHTRQQTVES